MNANILVPTLLFILLTPGFLFTIPTGFLGNLARVFGSVSTMTVLLHALLFAFIYYLLRQWFPQYYY